MNTIQTIWSALTSQNETLTNMLLIPLAFLDIYIGMIYFTSILNIDTTRKRKLIYVVTYGIVANILKFSVPTEYYVFFNLIVWPVLVFFILKATILKSILSEVVTMVTSSILELLFATIIYNIFDITSDVIIATPIYKISIALCKYTSIREHEYQN